MNIRIILFGFIFFFFSFVFVHPIFAQTDTSTYSQQTQSTQPSTDSYTPPAGLHEYTQNVMIEVLIAVGCQLTGMDPTSKTGQCLGVTDNGTIGYVEKNGGAIGMMSNMIASTVELPNPAPEYVSNMAANFGIAKKTYAATKNNGTGFAGLMPFMPLWQAFANIVYLLFVFVFILVGLGVMFRLKIDPRTVMTIQNSLPKIVVGLLLVTFSYAIAGFLIDMMWLSCYLVYGVINSSTIPGLHAANSTATIGSVHIFTNNGVDLSAMNPARLQGKTPMSAAGGLSGLESIASNAGSAIGDMVSSLFDGASGHIVAGILLGVLGGSIGNLAGFPMAGLIGFGVGAVIGGIGGGNLLGWLGMIIGFVIIAIAVFIALVRLWFALIRAYVFILLDVVLGPFFIAAGVIPGSPLSFGKWIRDLLANLSAFPIVIGLLAIGKAFMNAVGGVQRADQFVPPLVGNPGKPNAIASIIGLAIIFIAPHAVTIGRDIFKAPASKYAGALGQGIGAGVSITKGVAGQTASYVMGPAPAPKGKYNNTEKFRHMVRGLFSRF